MDDISQIVEFARSRSSGHPTFIEVLEELFTDVEPLLDGKEGFRRAGVLERLTEPDRILTFRVAWEDDSGTVRVNRGYRVQYCNALGPYKGGLRFDPSVSLDTLKMLAFEQTFKNALTGLNMGGAKGGADFDVAAASEQEVMRFCQSFMTELARHIGPDTDVPAGDIGVGSREIGYLYGQYRRLKGAQAGTLTGKAPGWGGSPVRSEATGWGAVYLAREVMQERDRSLEGMRCVVSGAGNAALHVAEKLLEAGAVVLTLSDRSGCLHRPEGFSSDDLEVVRETKEERRGKLVDLEGRDGWQFEEEGTPWSVEATAAFPAATQNEIDEEDVRELLEHGLELLCEVSNKPCTEAAGRLLRSSDVLYMPGKAANAGGVAVSGFEMGQNAVYRPWDRKTVDERLQSVMRHIHEQCVEFGRSDGRVDYVAGANRAGFLRVARALVAQGVS